MQFVAARSCPIHKKAGDESVPENELSDEEDDEEEERNLESFGEFSSEKKSEEHTPQQRCCDMKHLFETEGNEEENSLSLAVIKEADEFEEEDGEPEEELLEYFLTTACDLNCKNNDDFSEGVEMWDTEEY